MRQILAGVLLLITAAVIAAAQMATAPPTRESKAAQQIREVERARSEAIKRGDTETLARIYAADFTGVVGNGRVLDRAQLFDIFKASDPRVEFTTDDLRVRDLNKTLVVTGRLTGRTADGTVVNASRLVHIYTWREKRWQLVFGQSTALPKT